MSIPETAVTAAPTATRVNPKVRRDDSPPPKGRWRSRAVLAAVVAAAALVWVAPSLVARHVVSNGVELSGSGERVARVAIEDASFGWLSPIVLNDVVVHDLDGTPFARFASVASERPLWQIVSDRRRPGRFLVRESDVTVIVRDDGSNLTDVLRLIAERRSGSRLSDFSLSVKSGSARVVDATGTQLLQLDELALDLSVQRSPDQKLACAFTANAIHEGERLPVDVAFAWSGAASSGPLRSGVGQAVLQFAPLPLAGLAPRLTRMFPDLTLRDGRLAGQIQADWDFDQTNKVRAAGTVIAQDLHVSRAVSDGRPQELKRPLEELTFKLEGDYQPDVDELQITAVHLQSSPLTLKGSGRIEDLRGRCNVDLTGELQYDLAPFVGLLSADYHEHVKIDGLRTRRFAVRGPLVSNADGVAQFNASQLAVEADVSWEQANVFGIRSQQSMLITRLVGGVLKLEPVSVPVSGGQWRGVPRVDMLGLPVRAAVEQGIVLEDIEFSREMCHLWLKYLSPPMAQATSVKGRLSISLTESDLPLNDMAAGRIRGTLSIHSADVQPGPFADKLINLVATLEGLIPGRESKLLTALGGVWITFPQQEIDFRMTDGRVFHSTLEFRIGTVVVRTAGSVGLDESLDVLIEIALPDEWFRGSIFAGTPEGQVLRIPLQGTLDAPRYDRREVREFGKRLAATATNGLLHTLFAD